VFDRQTEVNRDVILALEALVRDRQQNRHAYHALSLRISELELEIARLHERDE
jgi:cell division protein FtsB